MCVKPAWMGKCVLCVNDKLRCAEACSDKCQRLFQEPELLLARDGVTVVRQLQGVGSQLQSGICHCTNLHNLFTVHPLAYDVEE